jgi:hypothetical protein
MTDFKSHNPRTQKCHLEQTNRNCFRAGGLAFLVILCGSCAAILLSFNIEIIGQKVQDQASSRDKILPIRESIFNPGIYFTAFATRMPFPANWILVSAHLDFRFSRLHNNDSNTSITIVGAGPQTVLDRGIDLTAHIFAFAEKFEHRTQKQYSFELSFPCLRTHSDIFDFYKTFRGNVAIICSSALIPGLFRRLPHRLFGICISLPDQTRLACNSDRLIVPINVGAVSRSTSNEINDRVALCISPLKGDLYSGVIVNYLAYYQKLGVNSVFSYLSSPSEKFVQELLNESKRRPGNGTMSFHLISWCLHANANFDCELSRNANRLPDDFFAFASTNYGQLVQQMDCMLRAYRSHRWVLFLDWDEYISPFSFGKGELVGFQVALAKFLPVAVSYQFRSAFFHKCVLRNRNSSFPRGTELESAARISHYFAAAERSKFMVDAWLTGYTAIHFFEKSICYLDKSSASQCSGLHAREFVIPISNSYLHHVRKTSQNSESFLCDQFPGQLELCSNVFRFFSGHMSE